MFIITIILPLCFLSAGIIFLTIKITQAQKEKQLISHELLKLDRIKKTSELEKGDYEKTIADLKEKLDQKRTELESKLKEETKRFKAELEEVQVMNEKLTRQKNLLEQELLNLKIAIKENNLSVGNAENQKTENSQSEKQKSNMWLSDFIKNQNEDKGEKA